MYNQVCYAFFDAFNPENLSGPIFEAQLSWKSAQIHQNPLIGKILKIMDFEQISAFSRSFSSLSFVARARNFVYLLYPRVLAIASVSSLSDKFGMKNKLNLERGVNLGPPPEYLRDGEANIENPDFWENLESDN